MESNHSIEPEPTEGDERDELEVLADDYMARCRRGDRPDVEEYAARLPDRAEEVRELFPAIAAMERWKPRSIPTARGSYQSKALAPERLGDYRIIREIGRGGMGVVYEAEQESLGRRVAVKVLPGLTWADDRPMKRFLREARTAAGMRHGHIVPVFDVGQHEGLHYYVMPLIAGVSLDRVLVELRRRCGMTPSSLPDGGESPLATEADSIALTLLDGSLGVRPAAGSANLNQPPVAGAIPGSKSVPLGRAYWRGVARVGAQVALAIQHAHDQGVLHRDIKPANLLVDADGVAWVLDFGLAKAMTHDDLSRTGDLVGTLRYMAPERFQGACDARSDLYSLGLTLYELLTLRPAIEGPDRVDLIRKIAGNELCRPRDRNPEIPIELETVVLKAIAPDPSHRYATAADLAADLQRFHDGQGVLARRSTPLDRLDRWADRNPAFAALGATSIILAIIAAYFFLHWLRPPGPPPLRPGEPPPFTKDGRPRFPPPEDPPPPREQPPP